jgi:hypothetical protein
MAIATEWSDAPLAPHNTPDAPLTPQFSRRLSVKSGNAVALTVKPKEYR